MLEQADRTKYVVGLGNPGRSYARTRHNIGFAVVDALAKRWACPAERAAFAGVLRDVRPSVGGQSRRVMMLQPQTYMNCSGRAVRQMVDFYKVPPDDLLIVLDDMALPVGQLRVRAEGSAGGHNGLSDILSALGSNVVSRLRIGIGSPPPGDWKDFVLSSFSPQEQETIDRAIEQAAAAVEDWVFHGTGYVMDNYNRKQES